MSAMHYWTDHDIELEQPPFVQGYTNSPGPWPSFDDDTRVFAGRCEAESSDRTAALPGLKRLPSPCTYFVWAEGTPYVKIGKADTLKSRIASLQTGSPFQLLPIAAVNGDHERQIHLRFSDVRLGHRTEWFRLTAPMLRWVNLQESTWRDLVLMQRLLDMLPATIAKPLCACGPDTHCGGLRHYLFGESRPGSPAALAQKAFGVAP